VKPRGQEITLFLAEPKKPRAAKRIQVQFIGGSLKQKNKGEQVLW
jgi:hypothetical protein